MAEKKIGTITHFFDNISVGIIKLEGDIKNRRQSEIFRAQPPILSRK
jgi:hypothetical protein